MTARPLLLSLLVLAALLGLGSVHAFSPCSGLATSSSFRIAPPSTESTSIPGRRFGTATATTLFAQDITELRNLLVESYPEFNAIIDKNEALWKKLSDGDGFTVFAPSSAAFVELGDKKRDQLDDPRNLETTLKIGEYHCITELVTFDDLYNSGGVITMAGAVDVDRSVTGGVFGVGGKEDGGVVVSGSKISASIPLTNGIVHQVDGLVSPQILWRYMDQLRIPGSR